MRTPFRWSACLRTAVRGALHLLTASRASWRPDSYPGKKGSSLLVETVTAILLAACRWVLMSAGFLVPSSLHGQWSEDWQGDFWRWMLREAASGNRESLRALVLHSLRGFHAALWARFRSDAGLERWREIQGTPWFPFAAGLTALLIVAALSSGFSISRTLAKGVPYPDAERLVLLAQGPPTLGVRLGFLPSEVEALRRKNSKLEALATYGWYASKFEGRDVTVAGVGSEFFRLLGVRPALGHDFDATAWNDPSGPFVISEDFFRKRFHSDPNAIGREYTVAGTTLRLAGVMPRGFSFLGMPISIWVLHTAEAPPPKDKWWLGLKGTIGKLKPGQTPAAAEVELRQILVDAGIARKGSKVHATPINAAVYRALGTYGGLLLGALGALLVWAAVNLWVGHKSDSLPVRFWLYFAAKAILPLLAIFLFVFEMMGVNRVGVTGGIWWGRELLAMWVLFCAVSILAWWAWRDQKRRCRDCFSLMHRPIRIGIPGQMLLDPAGEEVMCPRGHGSLYTSESVLGSELSDRWVGLEEQMSAGDRQTPA